MPHLFANETIQDGKVVVLFRKNVIRLKKVKLPLAKERFHFRKDGVQLAKDCVLLRKDSVQLGKESVPLGKIASQIPLGSFGRSILLNLADRWEFLCNGMRLKYAIDSLQRKARRNHSSR